MNHFMSVKRLLTIAVDGHGSMIAFSPNSGIEIVRVDVISDSTEAHISAARQLVSVAFQSLQAEGYPRAHDAEPVPPSS